MHQEDYPKTIFDAVHAAQFSVYGLAEHVFDFSLSVYGAGISHLGNLLHVSFLFTTPLPSDSLLYRVSPLTNKKLQLISIDRAAEHSDRENMAFVLEDPHEGLALTAYTGSLLYDHHFSEEEHAQAGKPLLWEGTHSLDTINFTGKMLYWQPPIQFSALLLKSEKTILMGKTHGLSYEELRQVLDHVQIINARHDILKQYQYDFDTQH